MPGEKILEAKPYAATRERAGVAWDVGAMRYKKYTDECPAFIGWFSLCELPFVAVADTALLPAQAIHSKRQSNTTVSAFDGQLTENGSANRNSSEQSIQPELPSTDSH